MGHICPIWLSRTTSAFKVVFNLINTKYDKTIAKYNIRKIQNVIHLKIVLLIDRYKQLLFNSIKDAYKGQ